MNRVLLERIAVNDSTDVVSQANEALGLSGHRGALFVAVALAAFAGLHLVAKAVAPIAEIIKSVIAIGLSIVLIAAAIGLAFVLAITAI